MPRPHRPDVRARMKEALQTVATAAGVPETSRTTLLALSELARRAGGDGLNIATPDLAPYELRVFSQNGEDGVIAEILRRTGTATKHFVEFGASTGAENNCALLADVFGWSGLFMEGGDYEAGILARKYRSNPGVTTRQALVFPDNVEELFREAGVPEDFDVLSVDIDGGDYYIWEALESYRPRLVVIEYNSLLDPKKRLVQPRDAGPWDHTAYYGASLGALKALGEQKGYRLVYTELTGNNAFFVRTDLPGAWPAPEDVPERSSNYWLQGVAHPPDEGGRAFSDLDER
jgi:hypothetical protein